MGRGGHHRGAYHQLANHGSGVGISVLCPGFVDTNIGGADRNRPDWVTGLPQPSEAAAARLGVIRDGTAAGIPAAQVAELVHDAVVERRFWIFPHPERVPDLQGRFDAVVAGENPPPRATAGRQRSVLLTRRGRRGRLALATGPGAR